MHKKFEINRTKIKGGCQSGRKVEPHNSKSDLPLNAQHVPNRLNMFQGVSLNFQIAVLSLSIHSHQTRGFLGLPPELFFCFGQLSSVGGLVGWLTG